MSDPSFGLSAAGSAVPAEFRAPWWIYAVFAVLALGLYTLSIYAHGYDYWWLVGLIALFSSYGMVAVFRCLIGTRSLAYAFDPRTQSWAMLADVFLAIMATVASYFWRYLDYSGWYHRWWWPVVAFVPGIALMTLRIKVLDWPNFVKAGAGVLLNDPGKIAHDIVTYLVLPGLLVALAVPVFTLFAGRYWWAAAIVALLFIPWVVGGMHDNPPRLNVWNIHDPFNWRLFAYVYNYRPGGQ